MAKVTFGAIVSDIRGKLRGDVFTIYRGSHIIRTYCANPADPNTERQQFCRGTWSTLAGCWWNLPTTSQELWEKYGQRHPGTRTGIGAFMQANMRLLAANNIGLTQIDNPPFTPLTPTAVQEFSWYFLTASTARISWTAPDNNQIYVQTFHRLNWDYSPDYNIYWKFTETYLSTISPRNWTHGYPTGTDIHIKMRSIDKWGRTSPQTHKIKLVVP